MAQQHTNIENIERLEATADAIKLPVLTEENIHDIVLDFELSEQQLLSAMEFYYSTNGEETLCLINRLISLYNVTQSFKIFQYMKGICLLDKIVLEMRLYLAKEICGYSDTCFPIMGQLCSVMKENAVCTTSRIDYILVLFQNKEQVTLATALFSDIINDMSLGSKYRFTAIKRLESDDLRNGFYVEFLQNSKNEGMYRVLAGQATIIKKYKVGITQRELYMLSMDESQQYNLRADAADVLLRYGDAEYKLLAGTVIKELGNVTGGTTIYENAQNAHTSSIEESAVEIFSTLYNTRDETSNELTFDFVKNSILEKVTVEEEKHIISAVLTRINLDQALYSNLHISLKNALLLVYSYMLQHDESLVENLITELRESYGICSTGIMERLANSLSGYESFMIRISFEDQIKGNLQGRLNARIKNLRNIGCLHSRFCECVDKSCIHVCNKDCTWNTDFQALVMDEMTISSNKPQLRINFLRVFRLYISEIMEEMREEFLQHISLTSFDLYFRKAMMSYDCS